MNLMKQYQNCTVNAVVFFMRLISLSIPIALIKKRRITWHSLCVIGLSGDRKGTKTTSSVARHS